jgi:hypothetical protein
MFLFFYLGPLPETLGRDHEATEGVGYGVLYVGRKGVEINCPTLRHNR